MLSGRCGMRGRLRPRPDVAALAFPLVESGLVLPLLCGTSIPAIAPRSQRKRCAQCYTAGDSGKERNPVIDIHTNRRAGVASRAVCLPS